RHVPVPKVYDYNARRSVAPSGSVWFDRGFGNTSGAYQFHNGVATVWNTTSGLENDFVRCLFCESDKRVGMASSRGVFRFDPESRTSELFQPAGGGSLTGVASMLRDS